MPIKKPIEPTVAVDPAAPPIVPELPIAPPEPDPNRIVTGYLYDRLYALWIADGYPRYVNYSGMRFLVMKDGGSDEVFIRDVPFGMTEAQNNSSFSKMNDGRPAGRTTVRK